MSAPSACLMFTAQPTSTSSTGALDDRSVADSVSRRQRSIGCNRCVAVALYSGVKGRSRFPLPGRKPRSSVYIFNIWRRRIRRSELSKRRTHLSKASVEAPYASVWPL